MASTAQCWLDLLLHTPGGDLAATESIVDYLHKMFNGDIRAVVPQLAMSAGTMMACSCREIIMGKQSNLGPIDPQFGGIPAYGVLKEFDEASAAVKADPSSILIWQVVVGKYHPTFIGECRHALKWSSQMVHAWLERSMFSGKRNPSALATKAVKYLGDHDHTKSHARHIPVEEAEKLLVVRRLAEGRAAKSAHRATSDGSGFFTFRLHPLPRILARLARGGARGVKRDHPGTVARSRPGVKVEEPNGVPGAHTRF